MNLCAFLSVFYNSSIIYIFEYVPSKTVKDDWDEFDLFYGQVIFVPEELLHRKIKSVETHDDYHLKICLE